METTLRVLSILKDVANVAFFVTAAIVTVLTYRHACRSLFAPIKTETYKMQLQLLSDIYRFFQDCRKNDIQHFDLITMFDLNVKAA